MPYITKQQKDFIDYHLHIFTCVKKLSLGELNYAITKLLLSKIPENYNEYNSLIGVLETCKLEFYRRAVAVYEDGKKEQNGDVFPI